MTFSLAKFTCMQCPNVRLLNWVANALNLHEKQKCSQFPNLMKTAIIPQLVIFKG